MEVEFHRRACRSDFSDDGFNEASEPRLDRDMISLLDAFEGLTGGNLAAYDD